MLVPVYVNGPPHSGQLQAWGHAEDGWWGLLLWPQRVIYRQPEEYATLRVAAWVPAARLQQWRTADTSALPRVELPTALAAWPAPPAWDGWYAGAWTDGPVPLPAGVEVDAEAVWKRR